MENKENIIEERIEVEKSKHLYTRNGYSAVVKREFNAESKCSNVSDQLLSMLMDWMEKTNKELN